MVLELTLIYRYTINFVTMIIRVFDEIKNTITTNLIKIKTLSTKSTYKLIYPMQKYVLLVSMHFLRSHDASHTTTADKE